MKTCERSGLLFPGLLLVALLSGCGGSSETQVEIPAVETIFYAHSVVFGNNSTLMTAGYNGFGQQGDGTLTTKAVLTTPSIQGTVHGFSAGANHSLAFTNNSSVWAWGSNYRGRLGLGSAYPTTGSSAYTSVPVRLKMGDTVRAVAAGWMHSLALVGPSGAVYSWGANSVGQLGNSTLNDSTTPVAVSVKITDTTFAPFDGAVQIASGGSHSLALKDDGTVWAWGSNLYWQLGNSTDTYSATAIQVKVPSDPANPASPLVPLDHVKQIAAAGSYCLAVKEDGTVWGWGYNGYGQLAQGPEGLPLVAPPLQVMEPDGTTPFLAEKVSAGSMHVLALKSNGQVWSWGFNERAQLGNGTIITSTRPVQVRMGGTPTSETMTGATDVYAFGNHSLAKIGNVLYGWGDNGSGQLAQTISTSSIGYLLTPVQVTLIDNP